METIWRQKNRTLLEKQSLNKHIHKLKELKKVSTSLSVPPQYPVYFITEVEDTAAGGSWLMHLPPWMNSHRAEPPFCFSVPSDEHITDAQ